MPMTDPTPRRRAIRAAMELDEAWLNQQAKTWQRINRLKEKQERYERVIVSPEHDHLKKFCRVLQPGADETWKDYTVFKTVSWIEAAPQWKHRMGGWCSAVLQTPRSWCPSAPSIGSLTTEQPWTCFVTSLNQTTGGELPDNTCLPGGSIGSAGRPS